MTSFITRYRTQIAAFTLTLSLSLFSVVMPVFAQTEYTGIVPDCEGESCNFAELIKGVKKIINIGTGFALFFSVVVIAYVGFEYMTSGDNANQRKTANERMVKVVKGIVLILAAWMIVNLILSVLVNGDLRKTFPI